ncbi:MAG: hypothetical protein PHS79_05385 [Patescibacteria group bacterium]|nr:hypothetical protein [Patescibacteria group bacterium]
MAIIVERQALTVEAKNGCIIVLLQAPTRAKSRKEVFMSKVVDLRLYAKQQKRIKRRLKPVIDAMAEFIRLDVDDLIERDRVVDTITKLATRHFPDIGLDENQLVMFDWFLRLMCDTMTRDQRESAMRFSLAYMLAHMRIGYFSTEPLKGHLLQHTADSTSLHCAFGVLALAWQVKRGREVVFTPDAYFAALPDKHPSWYKP